MRTVLEICEAAYNDNSGDFNLSIIEKAVIAGMKEAIKECAERATATIWDASEEIAKVNKQSILSLINEIK